MRLTALRMDATVPLQLGQLLSAPDSAVRAAAWDELIADHTRLLLAVARSFGGAHDEAMDRYSYILGELRAADFRRLRTFEPNRGASFSTWLTLTARKMCLDYHRRRYGRQRPTDYADGGASQRAIRRTLADCVASELSAEFLPDLEALLADDLVVRRERDAGLRMALARLSPRDRLLLSLRFRHELSAARISEVMGVKTPFHVYRRLKTVLALLRSALESRGFDSSDG
ncbi:MAG TPA: sigma-70 family RNA polymerase sigma factor [Gemmatimonadaceae bacterium]|nr:sigma-70 family RNA polymerase sigma factor [Gemmatimonadaceae bacterium]